MIAVVMIESTDSSSLEAIVAKEFLTSKGLTITKEGEITAAQIGRLAYGMGKLRISFSSPAVH